MTDVIALLRAAVVDALSTDVAALESARRDKSGQRTAEPPLAVVTSSMQASRCAA